MIRGKCPELGSCFGRCRLEQFLFRSCPVLLRVSIHATALLPISLRKPLDLLASRLRAYDCFCFFCCGFCCGCKPQPVCVVGQTSSRNENIYTSLITQGLFITSPSNSKTLGAIQRAFPVVVAEFHQPDQAFRLTIMNQPPGGKASFSGIPHHWSARPAGGAGYQHPAHLQRLAMVFVTSNSAAASVLVNVAEILGPGAAVVAGGLPAPCFSTRIP